MITKFSPTVNGVCIAFQYAGFEYSKDCTYARINKPRVLILRDVNIKSHSPLLSVSGHVFLKQKDHKANLYQNINCSGKGKKIIKRLTGEWVAINSTTTVRKQFHIVLEGLDQVGEPLIITGYIPFPPTNY